MSPTQTLARKPRPLLRSIRWRVAPEPGEASPDGGGSPEPPFEIFLTQSVLRDVERHLFADPETSGWGLLAGEVHECPVSGRRWVLGTDVLHGKGAFDEDGGRQVPEEGELALHLKAEREGRVIVGWYHAHEAGRPRFTARDRATNARVAREPWQFGLLLVREAGETAGAVMHPAVSDGGAPVPFHEVVSNDALLPDGGQRTCLAWTNLETEADIAPASPEPGEWAADDRPEEGEADASVSAAHEAPEETVVEGGPAWREPAGATAGARPWARRGRRLPARGWAALVRLAAVARTVPRLLRSRPTTGTAIVGVGIVVVVMASLVLVIRRAGSEDGDAAASLGGVPSAATPAVPPSGPEAANAEPPAPRPDERPAEAVETEPVVPRTTPPVPLARMDSLGNQTLAAISHFYGTTVALDEGRADCPALGSAYVRVEEAWIAYSTQGKAKLDTRLEGDRLERDGRLLAGVQDVERLFEKSGCSRP
ncbi:MAG: hypothetical protein ACE5HF_06685 [Gemmatimonadota bacterium]